MKRRVLLIHDREKWRLDADVLCPCRDRSWTLTLFLSLSLSLSRSCHRNQETARRFTSKIFGQATSWSCDSGRSRIVDSSTVRSEETDANSRDCCSMSSGREEGGSGILDSRYARFEIRRSNEERSLVARFARTN